MNRKTLGLIGLGAFGSLAARHLARHFEILGHDPVAGLPLDVIRADLAKAASAPIVLLAVPVQAIESVCREIAPHIQPGTLVLDVASVKINPMASMRAHLPAHARLVGTHPLFGPQSAARGIAGQSLVLCPADPEDDAADIAEFARDTLSLDVHVSTPEDHDRAMASVQGLTHLIAKVISDVEPASQPYTTKSYDLLMEAARLVGQDSDELFRAIEQMNPHSSAVRDGFFSAARELERRLERGNGAR